MIPPFARPAPGLTPARFRRTHCVMRRMCLALPFFEEGGAEARVRADSAAEIALAARGTPTLVTPSRIISGVPDTATLRRLILRSAR